MSNYYYRNNEGNWFVSDGKELYPVEFSCSMECAYKMGQVAILEELKSKMTENGQYENLMQVGNS